MPENKPHVGAEEIKQDSALSLLRDCHRIRPCFVTKLKQPGERCHAY
jgi:hypothetical protein